jgi:hypothetical protein
LRLGVLDAFTPSFGLFRYPWLLATLHASCFHLHITKHFPRACENCRPPFRPSHRFENHARPRWHHRLFRSHHPCPPVSTNSTTVTCTALYRDPTSFFFNPLLTLYSVVFTYINVTIRSCPHSYLHPAPRNFQPHPSPQARLPRTTPPIVATLTTRAPFPQPSTTSRHTRHADTQPPTTTSTRVCRTRTSTHTPCPSDTAARSSPSCTTRLLRRETRRRGRRAWWRPWWARRRRRRRRRR